MTFIHRSKSILKKQGFTLVELLSVLVIFSVIMVIAAPLVNRIFLNIDFANHQSDFLTKSFLVSQYIKKKVTLAEKDSIRVETNGSCLVFSPKVERSSEKRFSAFCLAKDELRYYPLTHSEFVVENNFGYQLLEESITSEKRPFDVQDLGKGLKISIELAFIAKQGLSELSDEILIVYD